MTAKLLVCHGGSDPHVPFGQVGEFGEEMTEARVDWQVIVYGGAQHGFTRADAIAGATPGVAYDERADRRSFSAISAFLSDAFAA